jgi:hypothetical protein
MITPACNGPLPWRARGRGINRFHQAGADILHRKTRLVVSGMRNQVHVQHQSLERGKEREQGQESVYATKGDDSVTWVGKVK